MEQSTRESLTKKKGLSATSPDLTGLRDQVLTGFHANAGIFCPTHELSGFTQAVSDTYQE